MCIRDSPGTIRYTGSDFQGYVNSQWVSLTADGGSSLWNTGTNGIDYTSGNVGVGTTATTGATLHVEGNGPSDGIKVTRVGSTVETELWSDGLEGGVGTMSNHDFRFVTNNFFRGEISANGNWGIGTGNTNPVEQLDVNGGIKVGNTTGTNQGTIRYNSGDFEGYTGTGWVSLTGCCTTTPMQSDSQNEIIQSQKQLIDENKNLIDQLRVENELLRQQMNTIQQLLSKNEDHEVDVKELGKLGQNRPNPFDVETEIPFFIPEGSQQAILIVTNISGQIIKTLPITQKGEGIVRLTLENISAGTLYYSLYIDDKLTSSKKMVVQP